MLRSCDDNSGVPDMTVQREPPGYRPWRSRLDNACSTYPTCPLPPSLSLTSSFPFCFAQSCVEPPSPRDPI